MKKCNGKKVTFRRVRHLGLAAVAFLAALLIALPAWAAPGDGGTTTTSYYHIHTINEKYAVDEEGNEDDSRVEGYATFSTDAQVNFYNDDIFYAEYAARYNFQGIKRMDIAAVGVNQNSPVQFKVDAGTDKNWKDPAVSASQTTISYQNKNGISYSDFNSMMRKLSLSFDKTKGATDASVKLVIKAYNTTNGDKQAMGFNLEAVPGRWSSFAPNDRRYRTVNEYSCTVKFYSYATGEIDPDTVQITYQGEDDTLLEPQDKNGGEASFVMRVTDYSDEIQDGVEYGYQLKKSSEQWSSSTKIVKVGELGSELSKDEKFADLPVTVTGFDAGTTYEVRGVFITDGKNASYTTTDPITISYDKPVINTFGVGNVTKSYKGGADGETMNISLLSTYNYTGYDETVTTAEDLGEVTGPRVKATLYFTSHRQISSDGEHDESQWTEIWSNTRNLLDAETGEISRNIELSTRYTLTADPADPSGNTLLDSAQCAYKLVLTDLISGYSVYRFSDSFSVDSTPPSAPVVEALAAKLDEEGNLVTDSDGNPVEEVVTDTDEPVGGAGGSVKIRISGSVETGSGLKEYSYTMYHLTTRDAVVYGNTIPQVYAQMANFTQRDHGTATFVSDTGVAIGEDGMGTFTVAKDGYYRVDATAVDQADRVSGVTSFYLRVDLSVPETPQVRLARVMDGGYGPYDNRTYTNDKVWIFAKSNPVTGKKLAGYEFSTDGGLTWLSFKSQTSYTDTDGAVLVYQPGSYTNTETFQYDVAFDLSAAYDDYQTILVRAVDNMRNVSLSSDPVIMRTVGKTPQAVAEIQHVGIEVALAVGNSNMKTADLTPQLKNAAAKKINEKYFGTGGSATPGADNFNPYLLVKDHTCHWGFASWTDGTSFASDISCSGRCHDQNCPYEKYASEYSIYKPEQVNIQGMKSASAQQDTSAWKFYDVSSNSSSGPDADGYIYQNADTSGLGRYESTPGEFVAYSDGKTGSCLWRPHHIIDMTSAADKADKGAFQEILFVGHANIAMTNWLYLPFDNQAKKVIMFSMDTGKANFHTYYQSGFLFNTTIRQNGSTWVMSGYRLAITKGQTPGNTVTDVTGTQTANLSVAIEKFADVDVASEVQSGGTHAYTKVDAVAFPDTAQKVKNFRLTMDGEYVDVEYTNGKGNCTEAAFENQGQFLMQQVHVPRPTVGGSQVTDTNCYGFGPYVGYGSHSCQRETRVTFSDISMVVTATRTLAQVVTEPQWGSGKAKFIANISNSAVEDFKDPALTSQIQWRLNNDKARYIGWGVASNEPETIAFLKRIAGENATAAEIARVGMYEKTSNSDAQQIDEVATYITTQYFDAFGYDATGSTPVKNMVSGKGTVFTMDDIGSMKFEVTPEKYLTSSANPDYPAGRWYMVHDALGAGNELDIRNGSYSDALEFNITLPGRYTIYFAPDRDAVLNGQLDPEDAIFDFVVNQKPVALFNGTIAQGSSGEDVLSITDSSYDPDSRKEPGGIVTENGVQIAGIVKREWRYEVLTTNSSGELVKIVSTDWSTNDVNGASISTLTGGKYTKLAANMVLTVYERVTDVVARRKALYGGDGSVIGYTYEQCANHVSDICQRNITEKSQPVTNPPLSAITLDKVFMYDTAIAASREVNKRIEVTRESSQPQGKNFAVSWAIDLGASYKLASRNDNYIPLTRDAATENYTVSLTAPGETTAKTYTVLTCVTKPTLTGGTITGVGPTSTGGVWTISYDFISKFVPKDSNMVLQVTETAWGYATASSTKAEAITDASARAIYFSADTYAPVPQIVVTNTVTKASDGTETLSDYEASKYLDVTDGSRSIRMTVSGSKDSEGKLAGYAYYLYTKNVSGNPDKYYKLETNGTLTQVADAKSATVKVPDTQLTGTDNETTINLSKSVLKAGQSSLSISIAIWAYDNRTDNTAAITGANETKPTKIEDIKFTTSQPMPPEITVSNGSGAKVAYISNETGFYDQGANRDTDKQSSPDGLNYAANSAVTVKFGPRQNYFKQNSSGGYDPADSSTGKLYYEDIYRAADMTNSANIRYSVYYRSGSSWLPYTLTQAGNSVTLENREMAPGSTITLNETNYYRVTAAVINGAGAVSAQRTVEFELDLEPPTKPNVTFTDNTTGTSYRVGTRTQQVNIRVADSTDNYMDGAYYSWTYDNGASWHELDTPTKDLSAHQMVLDKTGTYNVRIRAMDKAGNTSEEVTTTIQIDATNPVVPAPSVEAKISDDTPYETYLIGLFTKGEGTLYAVDNSGPNTADTVIAVPLGEDKSFLITPEKGWVIGSITYGQSEIGLDALTDNGDGSFGLTVNKVQTDALLTVQFQKENTEVEPASEPQAVLREVSMKSALAGATGMRAASARSSVRKAAAQSDGTHRLRVITDNDMAGTITGAGAITDGESATLTITPFPGYRVDSATIQRGESEAQDITAELTATFASGAYHYTVSNVTEDTEVNLSWKQLTAYTVTVRTTGSQGSTAQIDPSSDAYAGKNPDGTYLLYGGEKALLLFSPSTNYKAAKVTVDGVTENLDGAPATYQFVAPEKDFEVTVGFTIIDESAAAELSAVVEPGSDGQGHGSITPEDGTMVMQGDEIEFVLTPDPGYEIDTVTMYEESRGITSRPVDIDTELTDLGNGSYSIKAYITADGCGISVSYKLKVAQVETIATPGRGGMIRRTDGYGVIPEGATVTYEIVPVDGFEIRSVTVDGAEIGKVSSYTFRDIVGSHSLQVRFAERVKGEEVTTHRLEVTANNVSDNDVLAEKPYQFQISDGVHTSAFTPRQKEVNYTFYEIQPADGSEAIPLEPNRQYTVTVRAYDASGNYGVSSSTAYTKANVPVMLGLYEEDGGADVTTKTVQIRVDGRGNLPDNTEYLVYYSTYDNMQGARPANEDNGANGWAKLDDMDQFAVHGLEAGTHYYFQIMARNASGQETAINLENVLDIQISPSAPPENSFWFKEQQEPGGDIVLYWMDPPSDVTSVQIYRDGTYLTSVPQGTNSYTDLGVGNPGSTLRGDSIYDYSYAYVNTAGTGSRRRAVTEEYYQAVNKIDPATGTTATGSALTQAEAKLAAMQSLITATACQGLYEQAMTYPAWPTGITVSMHSVMGSTINTGRIDLFVNTDSTTTSRSQKYVLYLEAYNVVTAADGAKTYVRDDTFNKAATEKLAQANTRNGAFVSWTGLNSDMVYQVKVKSISSTGPKTSTGGYDGSTEAGLERSLGKSYTVSASGFSYGYSSTSADVQKLNTLSASWTGHDAAAARYHWDTALRDADNNEYITFNRSPDIKLPAGADAYNVPGNRVLTDSSGKPYLLVDRSGSDSKFRINVMAWDTDGSPAGKTPSITGEMSGVSGSAGKLTSLPATESEAAGSYYQVVFDASRMKTGVYDRVTMKVTDGEVGKEVVLTGLRIVVNQGYPSITVDGGNSTRLMEEGKTYPEKTVSVSAQVNLGSGDGASLRQVRTLVLGDVFKSYFGTDDYNAILNGMVNGSLDIMNGAIKVMGLEWVNAHRVTGGGLSAADAGTVIDSVAPPITSYFKVEKDVYDSVLAANPDKVSTDTLINGTVNYWVETEYALANNLCLWLTRTAEGVTVNNVLDDPRNPFPVKLTAAFGGNVSSSTIYFKVVEPSFMKVHSNKYWTWDVNRPSEEYEVYANEQETIGEVFAAATGNDVPPVEDFDTVKDQPAYRVRFKDDPDWYSLSMEELEGDGREVEEYQTFRLLDSQVDVYNKTIVGTVELNTGAYSRVERSFVIASTTEAFDPAVDEQTPGEQIEVTITSGNRQTIPSGYYNFRLNNLTPNQTYFLWTGYILNENGTNKTYYSKQYVTVTTNHTYSASYFGFDQKQESYKELDVEEGAQQNIVVHIVRQGDISETAAKLNVTGVYYKADQFGNLLLDEDGNPIPVENVTLAKEAMNFMGGDSASVVFTKSNSDTDRTIGLTITGNSKKQGHMILRLTLEVDRTAAETQGYNYISQSGETMDVFLQDDEDEVTAFRLGIINPEIDGEKQLTEVPNAAGGIFYYEYQFPGAQVGFTGGETTFYYENTGNGELSNINAKIYKKRGDKSEESTDFRIVGIEGAYLPTKDTVEGATGSVVVTAESNLEDGVYEGWICFGADNVNTQDEVWLKVTQVIGQSTLRGRIYTTSYEPTDYERVGKATVSLYSGSTSPSLNKPPLYTTTTDEYGGTFEIPNILNRGVSGSDGRYYIVVQRDGYVMYNGLEKIGSQLQLTADSATYEFSLQLIGGDVNNDGRVNQQDMAEFVKYFNQAYNINADLAHATKEEVDAYKALLRCDYNYNGIVNALDRQVLQKNLTKTGNSYGVVKPEKVS